MKTRIYRPTPFNLQRMASMLCRGEVVGVPTETVYGLAANALDTAACAAIFEAKERPSYDPLIVHVVNIAQAKRVAVWNSTAQRLANRFWPGPLTLVLPRQKTVPDIVTSGLDTVAVRMPAHPIFRKILKIATIPLAAPSANPFGYISPTCAQHVKDGLNNRISAIVDGGNCAVGVESTILRITDDSSCELLRPGAITRKDLQEELDRTIILKRVSESTAPIRSPGLLNKHYSPRKPTRLYQAFPKRMSSTEAWVHYQLDEDSIKGRSNHFQLTSNGDGAEAAELLYRLLRELDQSSYSRINIEALPAKNPWSETLNDRLKRASAKG